MRTWPLLVLLACKQQERSQPVEVKVAPPPDPDASLLDLPPSARASIVPPPREEWPCAFDVTESQGIQARGHSVYTYNRTTCRLPLSMIMQGIWGCPDRFVRTDSDGMVRDRTFEYDDAGHLLVFHGHTRQRFTWDGDRLVSTAREQFGEADVATYHDRGDEIVAVDNQGQLQEVHKFENGRLVQVGEYVYGRRGATATIYWQGDRPSSVSVEVSAPVHGSVSRRFLYDCSK